MTQYDLHMDTPPDDLTGERVIVSYLGEPISGKPTSRPMLEAAYWLHTVQNATPADTVTLFRGVTPCLSNSVGNVLARKPKATETPAEPVAAE